MMTDNLQLQTTRLTNASVGNLIDDSLADIENCLRTIFKITADTPISQVMSIDESGDVTMVGTMTLDDDPTNNLECATKKYVDDNTTSIDEYKCSVKATSLADISAGGSAKISFDTVDFEDGDSGQWDSGDPTKVICKDAGDYLISVYTYFSPYDESTSSYFNPHDAHFDLYKNGSVVVSSAVGQYNDDDLSSVYTTKTFTGIWTLALNDYIEVECLNQNLQSIRAAAGLAIVRVS